MQLSDLKGFGPKRLALLKQLHIETCADLIRTYPHSYLDFSSTTTIQSAPLDEPVTLRVRVVSDPSVWYTKGKSVVTMRVSDGTGTLLIRFMNQPFRASQYGIGSVLFVHGKITNRHGKVLYNPRTESEERGIVPIYDLPKGLTQTVFREAVRTVLEQTTLLDPLPESLLKQEALMPLYETLSELHFPTEQSRLQRAKFRILFEDAFFYFLAVKAFRESSRVQNGYAFPTEGVLDSFLDTIPYQPTGAQLRVLKEVEADMRLPIPMNRLIQGDVGSGKTTIAEYALLVAVSSGKQGVLLAPTEILAEQHYQKIRRLFGDASLLYTGSMKSKDQADALLRIRSGQAKVIVGTHALLSDRVLFSDLGLLITDEQHRFGVEQRAKMEAKGIRPDVLVMSATPIPRTLALLLYADLSLSVIDEMPLGRTPVQTSFVPDTRRLAMYRYVRDRVKQNDERAFVVCPLIEKTDHYENLSAEEIFSELNRLLPDCPIGLLHGRMKEEEKRDVMERFRSGRIRILVSTTVIEVGVDIPEATYMIVEGCDHYGLATLHQLRGRVGRSDRPSFCYLLCSDPSEQARERIRIMLQSNDGFELAKKDMDLRGYGDLFGVRQSGEGMLSRFLRSCSVDLIEKASNAAESVLTTPSLQNNELIRYAFDQYAGDTQIARN
ncbi:MAG: ATP-dependent DNA helicase RecG [Clostridia bacterium]|nr:ATP-dependent DNA helicase RecG [Clostridia bacterium]